MNSARFTLASALAGAALLAASALAQAPSNDSLNARLDALQQKILVIERLEELRQEEAAAAAAKRNKVNAAPGHLGIASADGAYTLRVSGFLQTVGQHFVTDLEGLSAAQQATNNARHLSLRRVHTDLRGTAGNLGWRVHTNFAGNAVALLDVQFDWNIVPEFNLTVGKFKPPTGLERLLSSPRAPFVEGSYVTALQPNRDVGVQAHGAFGGGLTQYQVGAFNGAHDNQDNSGDTDPHYDLYLRLFAHPFLAGLDAARGFGLGFSASVGRREGGGLLTAVTTPGRQALPVYAATDTLDGKVLRFSPQAYYYAGPFGLIAEATRTTQAVRNGAHEADLANRSYAVTASWILTGEKNDYRNGPKVNRPNAWPKNADFGALELLARVHGIEFDGAIPGAFGPADGVESSISGGVALGWYLNNVFKIFAGYDHTRFANAAGPDRSAENVVTASFNVGF